MSQFIVISAIGTDRPGVVRDLSERILECGGNIVESRMSNLGQEFAMLLLVSGNWHTLSRLKTELEKLHSDAGLSVSLRPTERRADKQDLVPYNVDAVCLDQQGIVYNLARFFAARGVEIMDLGTRSYAAAHTGAPMFSVQMNIGVPAQMRVTELRDEFLELCEQLNLDAILEPAKSV